MINSRPRLSSRPARFATSELRAPEVRQRALAIVAEETEGHCCDNCNCRALRRLMDEVLS